MFSYKIEFVRLPRDFIIILQPFPNWISNCTVRLRVRTQARSRNTYIPINVTPLSHSNRHEAVMNYLSDLSWVLYCWRVIQLNSFICTAMTACLFPIVSICSTRHIASHTIRYGKVQRANGLHVENSFAVHEQGAPSTEHRSQGKLPTYWNPS